MQYGGGGGHRFMKLFHKIPLFFEGWLPLVWLQLSSFLKILVASTLVGQITASVSGKSNMVGVNYWRGTA